MIEMAEIPLEPLTKYTTAVASLMVAIFDNEENFNALDVPAHVALLDIRDAASELNVVLEQLYPTRKS